MKITELLAARLDLTPKNAAWLWRESLCSRCNGWQHIIIGCIPSKCPACNGAGKEHAFTAPNPFEDGAPWLWPLVHCDKYASLDRPSGVVTHSAWVWYSDKKEGAARGRHTNPSAAIILALAAADPEFNTALRACEDWREEYVQ